jgi:hypothetical protein
MHLYMKLRREGIMLHFEREIGGNSNIKSNELRVDGLQKCEKSYSSPIFHVHSQP